MFPDFGRQSIGIGTGVIDEVRKLFPNVSASSLKAIFNRKAIKRKNQLVETLWSAYDWARVVSEREIGKP